MVLYKPENNSEPHQKPNHKTPGKPEAGST